MIEIETPVTSLQPTTSVSVGLNPEQQAAVQAPLHAGIKVLAGAGTGKTKLIAHRFVQLVQTLRQQGHEAPQNKILAVTFTDDAAKELQSRIHQELLNAGEPGLDEEAWISTFHTCCYRILQKHGKMLGITQGPFILEGLQQTLLLKQLLQEIKQGHYNDITHLLEKYQLQGLVPANILSLESLQQLPLENISEYLDRIPKVLQRIKAAGLSPKTFLITAQHQGETLSQALKTLPLREPYSGEAFESLETYGHLWQKHFSAWATDGWHPLATALDLLEPKETDFKAALDFLAKPLQLFTYDRSQKRYVPTDPDFSHLDDLTLLENQLAQGIAAFYAIYQDALLTRNTCDFDGLINQTLTLLQTHPDLQAQYQGHFEAIIVDEFQDSNASQLELLKLLMRTPPNITVVGDEKQAIYGFRFAQRENLELIFTGQDHQRLTLQTNYRSTAPILAVANQLTCRIADTSQLLIAFQQQEAPQVFWYTLGQPIEPLGERPVEEPIGSIKQREARLIALEIQALAKAGRYSYRDMAILAKSHQKLQHLQQVLQELAIPTACRKDMTFFQEPVIKNAMALLRLAHNPMDDQALFRILQTKLNQRQLKRLAALQIQETGSMPLFEALQERLSSVTEFSPSLLAALDNLLVEIRHHHQLVDSLLPVEIFRRFAKALALSPQPEEKQLHDLLRTFEKLLYAFQETNRAPLTLTQALELLFHYQAHPELALPLGNTTTEMENDAVQLMTIHGSKGLEFPIVFVAYVEDAKPPKLDDSLLLFDPQFSGKAGFGLMLGKYQGQSTLKKELYRTAWHTPRVQAEEQRLFYVALTRAKERLYVLRARQSAAWTASEHFKTQGLLALEETQQPDYFANLLSPVNPQPVA